jgi:hypothetical protein
MESVPVVYRRYVSHQIARDMPVYGSESNRGNQTSLCCGFACLQPRYVFKAESSTLIFLNHIAKIHVALVLKYFYLKNGVKFDDSYLQ